MLINEHKRLLVSNNNKGARTRNKTADDLDGVMILLGKLSSIFLCPFSINNPSPPPTTIFPRRGPLLGQMASVKFKYYILYFDLFTLWLYRPAALEHPSK